MKYVVFLVTVVTVYLVTWKGHAQTRPEPLQAVAFEQNLGAQLPLDAEFRNERGERVTLARYFSGGDRPVVVALGYLECPMLCTLVHAGLVRALQQLKLDLGKDFHVVSVSIDPAEPPELALAQKRRYVAEYGRHGAADGWHSLVGDEASIRRVAETLGYSYAYDAETDQYAHPSGIVVVTPEGRVSRYFQGVDYDPAALRLGLVEASELRIGTAVDRLVLRCFRYDPETGRYNLLVGQLLSALALLTVVILVAGVGVMIWQERRS